MGRSRLGEAYRSQELQIRHQEGGGLAAGLISGLAVLLPGRDAGIMLSCLAAGGHVGPMPGCSVVLLA